MAAALAGPDPYKVVGSKEARLELDNSAIWRNDFRRGQDGDPRDP